MFLALLCLFVFLQVGGGRGEVGSELSKVFNVQKPNTEIEVGVPGTLTIYQIFTNSTYLHLSTSAASLPPLFLTHPSPS